MFHSVPALLIATIGAYMLIDKYDLPGQDKIIISLALGAGFLGHLVLDEIKSSVGFHGIIYRPKKSLGTALKLFSHSKKITALAYLILFFLVYINWPTIESTWGLINKIK
jgi:hypothetical protein